MDRERLLRRLQPFLPPVGDGSRPLGTAGKNLEFDWGPDAPPVYPTDGQINLSAYGLGKRVGKAPEAPPEEVAPHGR